ncbi:unnamed protein product [Lactuca saligna]|uniref:Hexosyltransferase n=1 Tax=Lactuca saligna TaxID=75948 RepID=A0AA35YYG3_LACSI|nr:unnamed protein product [Lactuca saligna]
MYIEAFLVLLMVATIENGGRQRRCKCSWRSVVQRRRMGGGGGEINSWYVNTTPVQNPFLIISSVNTLQQQFVSIKQVRFRIHTLQVYSSVQIVDKMSVNHPDETLDSRVFGRNRYKFLALIAIILLALSSILTSTVTLRFSAGNLNNFSDDIAAGSLILDDFDIIEIEAREKAVKHVWDAYINDRRIKLQPFWQAAFVAAYEDLSGDVAEDLQLQELLA